MNINIDNSSSENSIKNEAITLTTARDLNVYTFRSVGGVLLEYEYGVLAAIDGYVIRPLSFQAKASINSIEESRRDNRKEIEPWFSKGSNVADELTALSLGLYEDYTITQNKGYNIYAQKIEFCYRLSPIEKNVLFTILSYSGNAEKVAFLSHETLAFKLGQKSTSGVKAALNSLREKKFIDWKSGSLNHQTNRYYVLELNKNPYLILSEIIHLFRDTVVKCYGNKISIKDVDACILKVVEPPKNKLNGPDDFYGVYINELFSGIGIIYTSYFVNYVQAFTDRLEKALEGADIYLNIAWDKVYLNIFEDIKNLGPHKI